MTPEDYAEGFYVTPDGTLAKDGAPADASELPSQRARTQLSGNDLPKTQAELDTQRSNLGFNQREKDAFTTKTLSEIAESKGWKHNSDASKRNKGRKTYKTQDGGFRALDLTHGQYEVHNKNVKHLGQETIEGHFTKDRDPTYDFDAR